jgi:3'-phosphoadenosine 5'-phosphosulfate sulfotransferase (PAPS reductase)/FAD synthetase
MNLDLFRKPIDPVGVGIEQRDGVPLLVGFGGGVNSMAALVMLRDWGLRPDLITFADTGGEKPETYKYLLLVEGWLRRSNFPPLCVVRNESPIARDSSLEASSLRLQTLPSRAFGLSGCALKWKVEPQEKFTNNWPPARACWESGRKPIKVLGYDGDEENRASIREDKKYRYWYPLYERGVDRAGCELLIRKERMPVPPKSACFFCPSSKTHEVLALAKEHPDLLARALEMERVAAPHLETIKGLGREWSWTELITMTPLQRSTLREQPVESCLICADQTET